MHMIDNLGGRLGSFDRLEKELAPGRRWSPFDRAIGAGAFFAERGGEPAQDGQARPRPRAKPPESPQIAGRPIRPCRIRLAAGFYLSGCMGPRQDIWRSEAAVPRRQTPPTMLAVPPARLRWRAASAIHGPTPSTHHLP